MAASAQVGLGCKRACVESDTDDDASEWGLAAAEPGTVTEEHTVPAYVRAGMRKLDAATEKMVRKHSAFEETRFDLSFGREWHDWCWFEQAETSFVRMSVRASSPANLGSLAPVAALVRADARLDPRRTERDLTVLEREPAEKAVQALRQGWAVYLVGVLVPCRSTSAARAAGSGAGHVTLRGCEELLQVESAVRRLSLECGDL